MVDFNNLLSRFVLAAPRALNDEGRARSDGRVYPDVDCWKRRFIHRQDHECWYWQGSGRAAGAAADQGAARPDRFGGRARGRDAGGAVRATKTYTARQTARFYPGWRDWKTAFEQAAAAPRPQTDPPNTGGAGPAAPRPVSILGAPFALEMFRKLPASGSVAAGNVEAAEVLGLCDKMPALGASMLPEAVRIQSFAVALEAAAGEAAHNPTRLSVVRSQQKVS